VYPSWKSSFAFNKPPQIYVKEVLFTPKFILPQYAGAPGKASWTFLKESDIVNRKMLRTRGIDQLHVIPLTTTPTIMIQSSTA
jgi:hypothetical protein